jgi:tetratricopeptide (TPR) repeat protein
MATMEECVRLGEMAGYLGAQTFTRAQLSVVYADLGAVESSLELAHLALAIAKTQYPSSLQTVLGRLAQLHLLLGNLPEAEVAIEQGKQDPRWKSGHYSSWSINLAEGELALRQSDYKRAMAITEKVLTDMRRSEDRADISRALYLQGQILQTIGQTDAARESLREAQTVAEALGSQRILWRVLIALSRLEANPTEAEHRRQKAQDIVEYIADNTPTPELRASFLELPEVQAVFDK